MSTTGQAPGFTKIDNAVIDRLPDIALPAVKVLLALTRRSNAARLCWPSVETIGEDTGLCVRAVRRAIRDLVRLGLLSIDKRPGTSTNYRLLTPDIGCNPEKQVGTSHESTPPTSDERGGGTSHESTPLPSDVPLTIPNEQDSLNKTQLTKPKARGKAAGVEIPSELDSVGFHEAWQRWISYRRKRKLSCLSECLTAQLSDLAKLGTAEAIAEINQSIKNSWQSVCYSGAKSNGHAKRSSPIGAGQRHAADRHTANGVL